MLKKVTWFRTNSFDPKRKKKNWFMFKKFFVKRKLNTFLYKLKGFFKTKTILFNYYKHFYTVKSTRVIKNNYTYCLKKSSDKLYNFFSIMCFRLYSVLVHSHFIVTKINAVLAINNGLVSINKSVVKNPHTLLSCGDVLYFYPLRSYYKDFLFWRKLRKKRRQTRNKFRFKFLRRLWIKNFFEVSYLVHTLIYVRPLFNNELFRRKIKYNSLTKKSPLKKKKFVIFNVFNLKLLKRFWFFA